MNLQQIRQSLQVQLSTVPTFRAYATPPPKPEPPCLVVAAGEPFVEYHAAMSRGLVEVRFEVLALVGVAHVESAFARLDSVCSAGTGESASVVDALHANRTLDGLVSDVVVRQVGGVTTLDIGDTSYLGCTFGVSVYCPRS